MAQFDVYRNLSQKTQKRFPYFLEIQNNLHRRLHSRIVVPLATGVAPVH